MPRFQVIIAPAAAAASGLQRSVCSQSDSFVRDVLPVIRGQENMHLDLKMIT